MRAKIKTGLNFLFALVNLPAVGLFYLLRPLSVEDELFASFSQCYALIPGKIGVYFRRSFYRFILPNFGKNVTIGFGTLLSHRNTSIGDNVYIGPQSNIGMCKIGPECLIGSGVHILSGRHQHNFSNPDMPLREQGGQYLCIEIGANCWIGNCAVIMDCVPAKSVIGAAALIVKAPEPGIYLGQPAHKHSNTHN